MYVTTQGKDRFLVFPAGFLWGVATAAGDYEDFQRCVEDVAIMADLGLSASCFSVSWSKVMPDGRTVSQAGLDDYRRLVDELSGRGIEPLPTLYHRDLPQALAQRGGWRSRDVVGRFTDYATTVQATLGDRVRRWTTMDEPFRTAFLDDGDGADADAHRRTDPAGALVAAHHLLLAHGTALTALRSAARPEHEFSLGLNFSPVLADGHGPEYVDAARRFDGLHNRFFLDPVLGNGYPVDVLADLAEIGDGLTEAIRDDDLTTIAAPIDRLAVTYYSPTRMTPRSDPRASDDRARIELRPMDGGPAHDPVPLFGWEQDPASLTGLLRWLNWHTGGLPLVVVDNGGAFEDEVDAQGRVRDVERIDYLAAHLQAVHAAIAEGADVRGYFVRSLLDSAEWSVGCSKRFGIVYVDVETRRRTPKDSAMFYRDTIASNAVPAGA